MVLLSAPTIQPASAARCRLGDVFNVTLSDVPESKDDLVTGTYTLPAADEQTAVAVKIIDMFGEEVLEVEEI